MQPSLWNVMKRIVNTWCVIAFSSLIMAQCRQLDFSELQMKFADEQMAVVHMHAFIHHVLSHVAHCCTVAL